jgi:hypothetical protein
MSSPEEEAAAVRVWEALFDEDPELAGGLFFDALLRDARTEKYRTSNDDDRRVVEPLLQPNGTLPPPVVVPPKVEQTGVLALPAASTTGRHTTQGTEKPRVCKPTGDVKKPPVRV